MSGFNSCHHLACGTAALPFLLPSEKAKLMSEEAIPPLPLCMYARTHAHT